MYSPPFRPMTEDEDKAVIDRINKTSPDFIWVGFDYLAGNINRAQEWMQDHNLEWLYRLIQGPRRLFKRYWYTNLRFI